MSATTMKDPKERPAAVPAPPKVPPLTSLDEEYAKRKATLDRLLAEQEENTKAIRDLEFLINNSAPGDFADAVEAALAGRDSPDAPMAPRLEELRRQRARVQVLRVAVDRAKDAAGQVEGRAKARMHAEFIRPYREALARLAVQAGEKFAAIEAAQDEFFRRLQAAGVEAAAFQTVLPFFFRRDEMLNWIKELRDTGAIPPGLAAAYGVEGRAITHENLP
jgi:hypothetical protein